MCVDQWFPFLKMGYPSNRTTPGGNLEVEKKILIAATSVLLPAVAQAQTINAQPGPYVTLGGGAAWQIGNTPNASTSTGWAAGGAAGYDFVGPRLELNAGYGQIPTSANIPGT